jgi:integrase
MATYAWQPASRATVNVHICGAHCLRHTCNKLLSTLQLALKVIQFILKHLLA